MDSELSQLSDALSFYLTLSSTSILHSELHFSNSPINYNTSKFPNQLFPNQLQHQQIPGSITTIKPASILKLTVFNLVHIPPNNDSSEQFNQQKKKPYQSLPPIMRLSLGSSRRTPVSLQAARSSAELMSAGPA